MKAIIGELGGSIIYAMFCVLLMPFFSNLLTVVSI